jgi:hypothetical protein
MIYRSIWSGLALLFLCSDASWAQKVDAATAAGRKQTVQQVYQSLPGLLASSQKTTFFKTNLDRMRFAPALLEKLEGALLQRSQNPFQKNDLIFNVHDSFLSDCRGPVVSSIDSVQNIQLCSRFFLKATPEERQRALLHEEIHLLGVADECTADGVAMLILLSARVPLKNKISKKCVKARALLEELK